MQNTYPICKMTSQKIVRIKGATLKYKVHYFERVCFWLIGFFVFKLGVGGGGGGGVVGGWWWWWYVGAGGVFSPYLKYIIIINRSLT